MRKKLKGALLGLSILTIGIFLLLDFLDVVSFSVFFPGWWTLIILIPCTLGFLFDKQKIQNLFGIGIGVLLLLACLDKISFDIVWKLLIAFFVIYIGILVTIRSSIPKEEEHGTRKKIRGILGVTQEIENGNTPSHIDVLAVFGGVKLDLSKATFDKKLSICVHSIFGGVEVILPKDCFLDVQNLNFFGGTDCSYQDNKDSIKKVNMICSNILGGTDIQ